MEKNRDTILVGAGAEHPQPFGLPSGNAFTWSTCYTENAQLYEALRIFYEDRLKKARSENELSLPKTYQPLFLFGAKSDAFKALIRNIYSSSKGAAALTTLLQDSEKDGYDKLTNNDFSLLYDELIASNEDNTALINLKRAAQMSIPSDAYYGAIEYYFPSLLNPSRRNRSFWKLINYYWTAFFSIAKPLIERCYRADTRLLKDGLYRFTLQNIDEVIREISNPLFFGDQELSKTYYEKFAGLFDSVLTTNYTSFSDRMLKNPEKGSIHLSGALWEFESATTLSTRDIRKQTIHDDEFVFPYLMTQAPVKPIVDPRQIKTYATAIKELEQSRRLVILGYSLCETDAHIVSLVRDYLESDEAEVVYLSYNNGDTPESICAKTRSSLKHKDKIKVMTCDDRSLNQLKKLLSVE